MRLLMVLLQHFCDFSDALIQACHSQQTKIPLCQNDGFFIDIRTDDFPDVPSMQIPYDTEMIRCTTTGIIEGAGSCILVNFCAARQATLKYFTRQSDRKSRKSRRTVEHSTARQVRIVYNCFFILILHKIPDEWDYTSSVVQIVSSMARIAKDPNKNCEGIVSLRSFNSLCLYHPLS